MRVLYFFLAFPLVYMTMTGLYIVGQGLANEAVDASAYFNSYWRTAPFAHAINSTFVLVALYWFTRLFAWLFDKPPQIKSYVSIAVALILWLGFPFFIDAIATQSKGSSIVNFFYYQGGLIIENGVVTEHGLRVELRARVVAWASVGFALILAGVITKFERRLSPSPS